MGKDRTVSHHDPCPSHLADEHSCHTLDELQTQTRLHPGPAEAPIAPTVISAPTVTTSSANTDNADTQPTSVDEDAAPEHSKSEDLATDKACYGADSDPSNRSESSDRSSSGSPDPTASALDDKLAGLAEWATPVPRTEEESGIASPQAHPEYPKDILIERQGVATTSQSSTPEMANHAQERKKAASQHQALQPQILPMGMHGMTSAFLSSTPETANLSYKRTDASFHEEPHELQPVGPHLRALPHAEPASAFSNTVDLESANRNALSHNGLPLASSPHVEAEVRDDPERESPILKLLKRIITIVGLVSALVLGIVAYTCEHDLLLACTIVIMIAGVDSMIQDF